jgi:hypothetical protein
MANPGIEAASESGLPNLSGDHYCDVLRRLHLTLKPRTYFEIGTAGGNTLVLATCASIAVDPQFNFSTIEMVRQIVAKPSLGLYQTASDAFFAQHSPTALFGSPIDMAFLDGMHRCEYLLRDFMNTERHCRRNSIIALHDCLPVDEAITARAESYGTSAHPDRKDWWAGDVWRTALLLKRRRPDLVITSLDAAPTGLVLITNLNPDNASFRDDYSSHVSEMLSWNIGQIGIIRFFEEMKVTSTSELTSDEQITTHFWL